VTGVQAYTGSPEVRGETRKPPLARRQMCPRVSEVFQIYLVEALPLAVLLAR
jgi:hypothetical protein